jgi:hypothetical protein
MDKGLSINEWTCCSRHSQNPQCKHIAQHARINSSRHTPLMDIQVLQRLDVAHPSTQFFLSITSFRMNDDSVFTLFSSYVILLVMEALNEASPRLVRWHRDPVETLRSLHIFCKKFFSHGRHTIAWSHLFWFPLCGGTGGCQASNNCILVI